MEGFEKQTKEWTAVCIDELCEKYNQNLFISASATQRCLVNGSLSRICSLKRGISQGKVLGPLLFLIYIH